MNTLTALLVFASHIAVNSTAAGGLNDLKNICARVVNTYGDQNRKKAETCDAEQEESGTGKCDDLQSSSSAECGGSLSRRLLVIQVHRSFRRVLVISDFHSLTT